MTELEKLEAGLPYDFRDPEVDARKLHAVKMCKVLNETDPTDYPACEKAIRELFGSVGKNPVVLPRFNCDNGKNIHVGDDFLTNYNVTHDVPDNCLVGGVPARKIKDIPNDLEEE